MAHRFPFLFEHAIFQQNILGGKQLVRYLLRDMFDTNRASGDVDGTAAEPGPGTRKDVNDNLAISSGKLVLDSATDIFYFNDAVTRAAGVTAVAAFSAAASTDFDIIYFGFHDSKTASPGRNALCLAASNVLNETTNFTSVAVGSYSGLTSIRLAIILRTSGFYGFLHNGTTWRLVWIGATNNTATLYAGIGASTTAPAATVDYFKVVAGRLPTPLAYDTFTRSNGALGSTETTGPDGQIVAARAWTGSTWTISTNKAINTPTGTEKATDPGLEGTYTAGLNASLTKDGSPTVAQSADVHGGSKAQEFTAVAANNGLSISSVDGAAGGWYRAVLWAKRTAGTADTVISTLSHSGSTLAPRRILNSAAYTKYVSAFPTQDVGVISYLAYQVGGGPFDTVVIDDVSIKNMVVSELFSTVDCGNADVVVEVGVTFESSPQTASPTGVVLNMDSASNPQNYVVVFMGTLDTASTSCKVSLWKYVAGAPTQVLAATTVTYSAGAKLRVFKFGSTYRIFYNDLAVGAAQTISDAGIISNTLHGTFSTYEGNTLDDFAVYSSYGYDFLNRM